jgi:hypothetical protein
MKKAIILCFSLFFCLISTNIFAEENRNDDTFQINWLATNFGAGFSAGLFLNENIFLGGENFNFAVEEEDEVENEKIELDFKTSIISAKFFPFDDSAFFLQGGMVYRDWKVIGHFYDSNQDGTVGANEYVKITVTFPEAASIYGLGALWIWDSGISFGLGAGAISGGAPDVEVEADNGATQTDIDREEARIKDDLEQYKTVGFGYISLGFTF